eukprot:95541_1
MSQKRKLIEIDDDDDSNDNKQPFPQQNDFKRRRKVISNDDYKHTQNHNHKLSESATSSRNSATVSNTSRPSENIDNILTQMKSQTTIILDYDDTLFPTTVYKDSNDPNNPISVNLHKIVAALGKLRDSIRDAFPFYHIALITNGGQGWINKSFTLYPEMKQAVGWIPIISAYDLFNKDYHEMYLLWKQMVVDTIISKNCTKLIAIGDSFADLYSAENIKIEKSYVKMMRKPNCDTLCWQISFVAKHIPWIHSQSFVDMRTQYQKHLECSLGCRIDSDIWFTLYVKVIPHKNAISYQLSLMQSEVNTVIKYQNKIFEITKRENIEDRNGLKKFRGIVCITEKGTTNAMKLDLCKQHNHIRILRSKWFELDSMNTRANHCSICGEAFRDKFKLTKHVKTHNQLQMPVSRSNSSWTSRHDSDDEFESDDLRCIGEPLDESDDVFECIREPPIVLIDESDDEFECIGEPSIVLGIIDLEEHAEPLYVQDTQDRDCGSVWGFVYVFMWLFIYLRFFIGIDHQSSCFASSFCYGAYEFRKTSGEYKAADISISFDNMDYLMVSRLDGVIEIWDVSNINPIWRGDTGSVLKIVWSPSHLHYMVKLTSPVYRSTPLLSSMGSMDTVRLCKSERDCKQIYTRYRSMGEKITFGEGSLIAVSGYYGSFGLHQSFLDENASSTNKSHGISSVNYHNNAHHHICVDLRTSMQHPLHYNRTLVIPWPSHPNFVMCFDSGE